MYDKEYQEMYLDSALTAKTNDVLGVHAAWIIAAFGMVYVIVTLSAVVGQYYSKTTDAATAIIIAVAFVLCSLFAGLTIKLNRIHSFDMIKNQFKETGRYWG